MKDNAAIVDVDGSYLYKKRLRLEASGFVLAPMTPPTSAPLSGWDVVTEANGYDNGPEATMCHCGHGVQLSRQPYWS